MKKEIEAKDFDFEYNGSTHSEKDIIEKGYHQLSGKELLKKISDKTVYGDYLMGYKYVTDIYKNGTAEGVNNVGSHNFGSWHINMNDNTLNIKWENGWFDTITRAYDINGNIEFYDVDTGNWRTTFKGFKKFIDKD